MNNSTSIVTYRNLFQTGSLVITRKMPGSIADYRDSVQSWSGELKARDLLVRPENLLVCTLIPEDLVGQVIETAIVELDTEHIFLVKILTVVEDAAKYFWVLANELHLVKRNENNI